MRARILALSLLLLACNSQPGSHKLQQRVDSLEKQLNNAYKPGLGEFMSSIQVHHAKLYFAGRHANWKLADFEVHEIMEALEDSKTYAADRPETKLLPMLNPALDSINAAIAKKDTAAFNGAFVLFTAGCNHCHAAVHYEFNKVKIPAAPPFSNQDF